MTNRALWMGWNGLYYPIKKTLENAEISVSEMLTASEGLEIATNKAFSFICLTSDCPAGTLRVSSAKLDDPVYIGCEVTRAIRRDGQNTKTPIILIHNNHFIHYSSQEAIGQYKQAGVNDFFNWSLTRSGEILPKIRKYLR